MNLSFFEKYVKETTWHGKATVMSLYHMAQTIRFTHWTLGDTADYFGCSNGLVSENLKLARALDTNPRLASIETRQEALKRIIYR